MDKTKIAFIDLETDSLNPRSGVIKLVVSAIGNEKVSYRKFIDDDFRGLLKNSNILKVFHNAKFDVEYLVNNGCEVNNYHCTLLMAQVLGEEKLSLKELTKKYLGVDMDKSMQHSDNWQEEITKRSILIMQSKMLKTLEIYSIDYKPCLLVRTYG